MTFEFKIYEMKAMAEFVAELVRQGVVFKTTNLTYGFRVELTGGF